jgi:uncharacterized OB-fold protein
MTAYFPYRVACPKCKSELGIKLSTGSGEVTVNNGTVKNHVKQILVLMGSDAGVCLVCGAHGTLNDFRLVKPEVKATIKGEV